MRIVFYCLLLGCLNVIAQVRVEADSVSLLVDQTESVREKIKILNQAAIRLKDADLKRSFGYASQAYQLAIKAREDRGQILAQQSLGRYYTRIGRHDVAMENYLDALAISQNIKDNGLISQTYKIIGNSYYFKNDIDLALQYYQKALRINESLNDTESTADLLNNIALVFLEQNKLDSAEIFLEDAVSIYEKLHVSAKLANAWLNWGELMEKRQLYEEAVLYYQKALAIDREKEIKLQEGYTLAQIASALMKLRKVDDAIPFGQQALTIALKEEFQPLLLNSYNILYQLHKVKHDHAQALTYHEKLLTIKDSLFNKEKAKQIEELRTKYESEQKDKENLELLKEAELRNNQLLITRLFLGFSVGFIIIVGVLAYNYYQALQVNKKARMNLQLLNEQIQEKNEEITAQSEELSEANQEIATINENLEDLVKEKASKIIQQNKMLTQYAFQNAHKVRGPLARLLGLVNVIKLENNGGHDLPFLLEKIEITSLELDEVVKEINAKLNSEPIE